MLSDDILFNLVYLSLLASDLFTIFNRDYPAGAIINDEECPYVIAHFKMNEEKRGNVFKIVWFLVIIGGIQT